MKTSEYWKGRFLEIEKASNAYGQDAFRKIEPAFDKALRNIEGKINAWYGRFAKNNNITMQEARRLLTTKELKEFKWDVDTYIKYGRENALNEMWMKELENASARVHISRLEALKIRTQHEAEIAFGNEIDGLDTMARKVFTEDYYHSIYEVQKGFNIGWEIGQIDERKLNTLISKPWAADGKNFSDRIWSQKTQLVNELHNQLTRTCIMGKAPDDAIKAIANKFNATKGQAGRLVMTEQAYFHSVAQKEAFKDLDVEEYEIVATLDSRTSETCQEMDGEHLPMKDYQPGVTAPPFHVWCRSVTVPYFEDNPGERAARGEDGKTYYVPDSITYKEWKKSFVDGDTDGLKTVDVSVEQAKNTIKKNVAQTIQEANEFGADILNRAYENNRIAENLNLVPLDELTDDDYFMDCVNYGKKCSVETANTFNEVFEDLTQKFNTTLHKVRPMSKDEYLGHSNSFAFVYHDYSVNDSTMVLNISKIKDYEKLSGRIQELGEEGYCVKVMAGMEGRYVATHEFAHTLMNMEQTLSNKRNWSGMDFDKIKGARKEIKKVYDSYLEELRPLADARKKAEDAIFEIYMGNGDESKLGELEKVFDKADEAYNSIRISEYSLSSVDEFLAEGFTDVEIGENPSRYSIQVHDILTKYFGR